MFNCVGPPITNITNNMIVFDGDKITLTCDAINDVNAIDPLTVVWYNPNVYNSNQMAARYWHIMKQTKLQINENYFY